MVYGKGAEKTVRMEAPENDKRWKIRPNGGSPSTQELMITAPEVSAPEHPSVSRSFSTWTSICVFLSELTPYTFIQKPVSTEVKVWSSWLWWSKENSPFEELRLHLHGDRDWKDSEWKKTHTGPKKIMRLTKAAWWIKITSVCLVHLAIEPHTNHLQVLNGCTCLEWG